MMLRDITPTVPWSAAATAMRAITAEQFRQIVHLVDGGLVFGTMLPEIMPVAGYRHRWNNAYSGKPVRIGLDVGGYQVMRICRRDFRIHRVLWMFHYGDWPCGYLDHINGVRTDNRIENLRIASPAENMRNMARHRNNTSGMSGVVWDKTKGRWTTRVGHEYIGSFVSKDDAIFARIEAQRARGYSERHGIAAEPANDRGSNLSDVLSARFHSAPIALEGQQDHA